MLLCAGISEYLKTLSLIVTADISPTERGLWHVPHHNSLSTCPITPHSPLSDLFGTTAIISSSKPAKVQMATQTCGEPGCDQPGLLVWYCVDCSCWRCDNCWAAWSAHAPGMPGRDGLEHEKTQLSVVERLRHILQPLARLPSDEARAREEQLHSQDLGSSWFVQA